MKDNNFAKLSTVQPGSFGPLIELVWRRTYDGSVPELTNLAITRRAQVLAEALSSNQMGYAVNGQSAAAAIRVTWDHSKSEERLYEFCSLAQAAAERIGIHRKTAVQLVGTIQEFEDNIHEHSHRSASGLVAFSASKGEFEFVVADEGVGVLKSLQSSAAHLGIGTHSDALLGVAVDGLTRHGAGSGHGGGFRQLYVSLYSLNSTIRLRTGNAILVIDGQRKETELRDSLNIPGFIISTACFA